MIREELRDIAQGFQDWLQSDQPGGGKDIAVKMEHALHLAATRVLHSLVYLAIAVLLAAVPVQFAPNEIAPFLGFIQKAVVFGLWAISIWQVVTIFLSTRSMQIASGSALVGSALIPNDTRIGNLLDRLRALLFGSLAFQTTVGLYILLIPVRNNPNLVFGLLVAIILFALIVLWNPPKTLHKVYWIPLGTIGVLTVVFLFGSPGSATAETLSPAEQQAEYEEGLLSNKWFLCSNAGSVGCVDRGAWIKQRDPLVIQHDFVQGAQTREVTFIQESGCPGTWRRPDESNQFCLEQQNHELYVGWYDRNGSHSPLCLSFGRGDRGRGYDDPPVDCVKYFNDVERGNIQLSSFQ